MKPASILKEKRSVKWSLCMQVKYSKQGDDGLRTFEPFFQTSMLIATEADDLIEQYAQKVQILARRVEEFEGEGSGLNLEHIMSVKLNIVQFTPFRGSSYIPLPEKLYCRRKSVLNICNGDTRCFLYSIIAKLWSFPPQCHRERYENYLPHVNKLDLSGITFPMPVKQISKFEQNNQLSINVYGYDEPESEDGDTIGIIYPIRVNKMEKNVPPERCIDLLLLTDDEKAHYCLINDLASLVRPMNTKAKRVICRRCLWPFTSETRLENHQNYCYSHAQRIDMPSESENVLEFSLRQQSFKQLFDFVVYADFESILEPENGEMCPQNRTEIHIPCGFSYKVVSTVPEYSKDLVVYSGQDTSAKFVRDMLEIYDWVEDLFAHPVPMNISATQKRELIQNTEICGICDKFMEPSDRVADHSHLDGRFRCIAHNACNVNFHQQRKMVVVLHNLERYDLHLILEASQEMAHRKLSCIPKNTENFLSFSIDKLVFIDSFKFLSTSLEKLTKNLKEKGAEHFVHLRQEFPDHVHLLTRKLPFCYEKIQSFETLNETKIPPKEAFYSHLSEEGITDEDYAFVHHLWQIFDIRDLEEFMRLYVSIDTLILCDVMEDFRRVSFEDFGLDIYHFLSLPSYSFSACLKDTGVQLELFTHPDYYTFIEKGIRGGVAQISKRYSKANNPYVSGYDSSQDTVYLMYLDVNSLYSKCMTKPLPLDHFEFLEPHQFENINWLSIPSDNHYGYIHECDLSVSGDLHRIFASYPPVPCHDDIAADELSPYCKNIMKQLGIPKDKSTGRKLFCTLKPKRNYVIHYETLKCYLNLGLTLERIHKVMRFTQAPWMADYINHNIAKRQVATDTSTRDRLKLQNNCCYGKTCENPRTYKQVKLIADEDRLAKFTSKCNFKQMNVFSDELVAVEMEKTMVKLNKPIAVGFTILEHAKTLMYTFYYQVLVKHYKHQITLCLTDTDSLLFELRAMPNESLHDPYAFVLENMHNLFDTSNYPETHPLFSTQNCMISGLWKDECKGLPLLEYCALRPKCYSYLTDMGEGKCSETKREKGIKKSWIRKHLRHEMFKECLFKKKQFFATFKLIRSIHNTLYTIETNKVALSPLDTKMRICNDGIHCLPYGYNPH